jgi:hypothetical protein
MTSTWKETFPKLKKIQDNTVTIHCKNNDEIQRAHTNYGRTSDFEQLDKCYKQTRKLNSSQLTEHIIKRITPFHRCTSIYLILCGAPGAGVAAP